MIISFITSSCGSVYVQNDETTNRQFNDNGDDDDDTMTFGLYV